MKEYLYRRQREWGGVPRTWRRLHKDKCHNDTLIKHHCSDDIM